MRCAFYPAVSRTTLIATIGLCSQLIADPVEARLLCIVITDAAQELDVVRLLQRQLPALTVQPVGTGSCQFTAACVEQSGAVGVLVHQNDGRQMFRALPWLSRKDVCWRRMAVQGKVAEVAVLLEGVVSRLPLLKSPLKVDRPKSLATTHEIVTRKAAEKAPVPVNGAKKTLPAVPPFSRKIIAAKKVQRSPSPKVSTYHKPQPRPPVAVAVAVAHRWWANGEIQAYTAGNWWIGRMGAWEVGGSLSWYRLFVRLGYQLPSEWQWDSRVVRVATLPIALGWHQPYWQSSRLSLAVQAMCVLQYLWLRRVDLTTDTHTTSGWEVGGAVAHRITYGLTRFWRIGATIEARMVAGRQIEVPQGPTQRLSFVALHGSLMTSWSF